MESEAGTLSLERPSGGSTSGSGGCDKVSSWPVVGMVLVISSLLAKKRKTKKHVALWDKHLVDPSNYRQSVRMKS